MNLKEEIEKFREMGVCPICNSENVDWISSGHERDSSNDLLKCSDCGWYCRESSLYED